MRRFTRWLPVTVAIGCSVLAAGWSSGAFAGTATPSVTFAPRATPTKLHAPGRVFAAGSGDATGKRVVVYGGQEPGGNTAYSDTWVNRADGTWHAMCGISVPGATAPCGPGPRDGAGMADAANGVVLYGGFDGGIGGSPPNGDTWRWNGESWTRVCTLAACGPGDRALFAFAGNGTSAVMFGGLSGSGPKSDTWVFDGSSWTQACGQPGSPCGPGALAASAMAWDGKRFVLFGGTNLTTSNAVDDTWTFTGHAWAHLCGTSMSKPCGPAARSLSGFAFAANPDPSRQGAILAEGGNIFSSNDQSLIRDAWFFDATTAKWARVTAPWDGPNAVFDSNGSPPAGPNALLGVLAAKPGLCEVVYLGTVVANAGSPPTLVDRSYAAGSSPWTAAKPNCEPAVVPREPGPVTPTTIASVAPPTIVTAPVVAAAPELPKTGSAAVGVGAALGGALVALGALVLSVLGRGRRRISEPDT
ncbi:MAG: hypothetical protein JWM72_2558 [Actinomycetia bacterium]|nr:hypothetical protein [Actinomycetes bacterium]